MERFQRSVQRQDDIERQLAQQPRGLTVGQLARLYGVHRGTIYRDLSALEHRGTGLIKEGRRWQLHHRRTLYTAKFTPYELVSLFIAARLLSRHSDEQNPHVVSALEKLADALRGHSPVVATRMLAAAAAVREHPSRPEYVQAFGVITLGWLQCRKVQLVYHAYPDGSPTQRTFAPYFIEPAGPAFACYVVGMDELRGEVRTLKLERIHDARLTDERFTPPDWLDPDQLLQSAWGIMWGEDGRERVRLLFSARVARRVKESVWHGSQRVDELPDGSCLFTVEVGSLLEMKPWIRQWGPDVSVLEPAHLRAEIAAEAQATAALYAAG